MVTNMKYLPLETPDALFLTLAQAKAQLKIEESFDVDNDLINDCIATAQAECENYAGISFARRLFVMEASNFDTIIFQQNYVNDTIQKIEYYDEANELQTLPEANYKFKNSINAGCFEIIFSNTPKVYDRVDAVIVTVNQGWAVAAVPTPVKQAIKLYVSDYYERREDRGGITENTRAHSLLRPYRRY
jgi:uncharacterized phiE125 gp8 family phage protein